MPLPSIDRRRFFDGYRLDFGALTQPQVDGLNAILDEAEAPGRVESLEQLAYILATAYWETARTFQPIREYGRGKGRRYGVPDPETGQVFYGRGFVQLTWRGNYARCSELLREFGYGVDLELDPDEAMVPKYAELILIVGMMRGVFGGGGLPRWISPPRVDYRNARRTVNVLDQADEIAELAERFEAILRAATETAPEAVAIS